jgi:hypothetical protein
MGFQPISPDEPICARFSSLEIFRLSGVVPKPEQKVDVTHELRGVPIRIRIAQELLDVLPAVLAWTRQEANDFEKEKNCQGPYASILIGPVAESHSEAKGWFKEEQGELRTFEAFLNAREEIRGRSRELTPQLYTVLAGAVSDGQYVGALKPIDLQLFGETQTGQIVRDTHFLFSGEGSVSNFDHTQILQGKLERAISSAESTDPVAAMYFHAACQEADALKRFLFFFLSLEQQLKVMYQAHAKAGAQAVKLDEKFFVLLSDTQDRVDVIEGQKELVSLINTRNAIGHGRCLKPDQAAIASVERVARQLLFGTPLNERPRAV